MKKLWIVIVALAMATIACQNKQTAANETENAADTTAWYENDSLLQADLAAAIEDAKQLDASKISNDLMPIKKGTPNEEWATIDGKDMVLVVTLVDSSRLARFFGQEGVYRIDRELGSWVSLPGDWHMRMIQMYGLSPDCDYNIMVQFYADPAYIFRPAHTPEITTTAAGLEFPAYADEKYKVGETNFREWYRLSVASAFEDDSPLPWTQLGYTYDWHHGANRVGVSEYIVTHQSLVKVKSHESEWQFIQNLLKP